ncbi:MAG: permease [Xanthomonadales bacterium]|nr:permease [Xanthomonadales bacterium]
MSAVDIALAAIVLAGLMIQTMTGFGFNVVAVTLGAWLLPIKTWLPIVVALNLPMSAWVAWRNRGDIDWTLLLRRILPVMAVGFAAGVALAFVLSGDVLKRAFGALVAALALRELIRLLGQAVERREAAAHPARVWVLLAGLVQGLYASGGPLLVHALSRVQISRSRFRATLMTIWFTLNSGLSVAYLVGGLWTTDMAVRAAWLLPLVPIGLWVGDWLHHHASERGFAVAVQTVLLVAGLGLAFG